MTGLVVLDKPEGMTSFTAANLTRKITGAKKAGHTGTLDPIATGVLPVLLGSATRFAELLPVRDKAYRARLLFGLRTDTLDITGNVISRSDIIPTYEQACRALESFVGEISQVPPMYSALKRDGVRLYELARRGEEVERAARLVTVHSARLLPDDGEGWTLEISCSAGTYIRTIIDDLGAALGCGAVMTALRRTGANGFGEERAATLERLREAVGEGRLESLVVPVDALFAAYPECRVSAPQATRFRNGGALDLERLDIAGGGIFRVSAPDGVFLGLGETREGQMKVKRLLV